MKPDLFKVLEKKNPLLALQLLTGDDKRKKLFHFSLPKNETIALYVLGLGQKNWQKKLVEWLDEDQKRKVYLIIDSSYDLNACSLDLLGHSRLKVGNVVESFVWDHVYQSWELIGGSSDQKEELADKILGVELTLALYRDFGIPQLNNVMQNLEGNDQIRKGTGLFKAFKDIPAIICGAGASLEKSSENLKKVRDRALVFGGGSALGPLSRKRIPVHFLVACDPEPPFERFFRQTYFEVPLFYQNQVAGSLLNCHQGVKLCIGESGSFPLEKWLTKDFELFPSDIGWNVSTFATYVATFLGCRPVYFVGMDLSVSKKKSYAKGVEGKDERKNPITLSDRFGKEVKTRPDFLMAKKWFENFAEKHPETTFINASEEGLALKGIPYGRIVLSQNSFDLSSKIHQAVLKAPLLSRKVVRPKIQELEESLKTVRKILQEYIKRLSEGKNVFLCEDELDAEIFYRLHLLPVWGVWKYLLQNDEIIQAMKNPKIEKKLQEILFYRQLTEKFIYERNL